MPFLGDSIFKNKLLFNTAYTADNEPVGTIYWNSDEETLDICVDANVTLQVGQELLIPVKNQTGSQIDNGTFVMFAGSLGASGRLLIQKGIADGSIDPEYTLGIATEDIANGGDGKVTWFGKVRGIDTTGGLSFGGLETWSDGDVLYADPDNAGYLTNVEPQAPDRRIEVAAIIHAHASTGTLMVRPHWHQNIEDLDNVNGTAPVEGSLLIYDNANGYWDAGNDINNYLTFKQSHGELYTYESGVTVIASTANTYYTITGITAGESSGTGYAVVNATNGTITIGTNGAGLYEISFFISLSANKVVELHGSVFINGSDTDKIGWRRDISTANQIGSAGASGLYNLSASDVITFRMKSSTANTNIAIDHAQLFVKRIAR